MSYSRPCHVQGSSELLAELRERFGLKEGADTSTDGKFTVVQVRCLGACGLSPIMKVDDEFYGKVTKTAIPEILAKYGGNAQ